MVFHRKNLENRTNCGRYSEVMKVETWSKSMSIGYLRHIKIAKECENQSQRSKVSLKNFNCSSDMVIFMF